MNPIGWCDSTINPVVGCEKRSPGCDHCYALRMAVRLAANPKTAERYKGVVARLGGIWKWTGRVNFVPSELAKPRHWRGARRIFVGSMTDLCRSEVKEKWWAKIIEMVCACPQHVFMVLSKRPENYARKLQAVSAIASQDPGFMPATTEYLYQYRYPLPRLWLGASVENQACADARLPHLVALREQGWHTFVSCEPLLGHIVIEDKLRPEWIIAGPETGPDARPCHWCWPELLNMNDRPFWWKGANGSHELPEGMR